MSVTTAMDVPLRRVIPFRPRCWLYITHGTFGDGTNGQAGIHAQVGSEHRAIADVHVLVPKNAIPMIHYSIRRRTGHRATAQDVRSAGNIEEDFRNHAHRNSADRLPQSPCKFVGLRNKRRDAPALAYQHLPERPVPRTPETHVDMAVQGLHA